MSEDFDIQKMLGKIDKLPTLPFVVTALNDLIRNPQTSAADIHKIIMKDQSLSSRILKLVNSSFYGFSERISSISHAIVILGFNTVKNVALTASVFDMFSKDKEPNVHFDHKAFWLHSLGVAATARLLATKVKLPGVEDIFVAGLLHDIGKMVLDQYAHDKFVDILKMVHEKNMLIKDAEAEILNGVNHAQVGAWLGMKWKLPTGLVQMVGFHHHPMPDDPLMRAVACIHVADILARSLDIGSGGDNLVPKISTEAWNVLGIPLSDLDLIMKHMEDELADASAFIGEG